MLVLEFTGLSFPRCIALAVCVCVSCFSLDSFKRNILESELRQEVRLSDFEKGWLFVLV